MNLCKRNIAGFTLVEVLVVVAIIALLVAILVPSLKRARRQTQIVVVHHDLRQITMALDAYCINNKDGLPPTRKACGNFDNYQLPEELAKKKYLPEAKETEHRSNFRDFFDTENTYRYRSPGPGYFNGTFWDNPNDKFLWGNIWVPKDFPTSLSEDGDYYYDHPDDPGESPVDYAVWSVGPDPESKKFPKFVMSAAGATEVDDSRFPLPRKFWLEHAGDTGLITHFRMDTGLMGMSP